MAEPKPFSPAKLVVGVIAGQPAVFEAAEAALARLFGRIDLRSALFPFDLTDYYEVAMGEGLRRLFLSFAELVTPDSLAGIKLRTNGLEGEIGLRFPDRRRAVNIDPGVMTSAALIMGTAKDFAHRIPLAGGIYAHLELLFKKDDVRFLEWTYPDFRREECREFFLAVRRLYLARLRDLRAP